MIVWVRVVFRKTVVGDTVVGDWCFDYSTWAVVIFRVTLKMTTAQVVETSVTNNSLSKDYSHLDDHTRHLTKTLHVTLKMTTAQVVETSVTNNSLSEDTLTQTIMLNQ